jgi:hypothetical protein
MSTKLKYFIIVSLFISMIPYNGHASTERLQTISSNKEIVCTYERSMPDSNRLITHIPIFLLQNALVKDNDSYVSKFKPLYFLLPDYNIQNKLRNSNYSSTQNIPVNIYLPPPGYYIYGLENIRI